MLIGGLIIHYWKVNLVWLSNKCFEFYAPQRLNALWLDEASTNQHRWQYLVFSIFGSDLFFVTFERVISFVSYS